MEAAFTWLHSPDDLSKRVFLTPPEVAEVLNWDPRTVRRLIHSGDIPATAGGGNSYRIPARWVLERAKLTENLAQVEALESRLAAVEAKLAKLAAAFGGAA